MTNICHLTLGNLPIITIGGHLEGGCLSICPSSAKAVYPVTQASIWQAEGPPESCVLLIFQSTITNTSGFEWIATLSSDHHYQTQLLPSEATVIHAAEQLHVEACIDACCQTNISNGWYVCIKGEAARSFFCTAQALIRA